MALILDIIQTNIHYAKTIKLLNISLQFILVYLVTFAASSLYFSYRPGSIYKKQSLAKQQQKKTFYKHDIGNKCIVNFQIVKAFYFKHNEWVEIIASYCLETTARIVYIFLIYLLFSYAI